MTTYRFRVLKTFRYTRTYRKLEERIGGEFAGQLRALARALWGRPPIGLEAWMEKTESVMA